MHNPYGLEAMWKEGDLVSKVTLFILVIMSIGTWYIIITKCLQQGKIRKQGQHADKNFWEATSLDSATEGLDDASVYRFIAEKGIKSTKNHGGTLLERIDFNTWVTISIQRAIDKGTGNLEGADYLELRYEGYGIGGAAVMVDCLTDNKTRTVADVRHAFSKNGGNLGTDGSVAFNFIHQGYLVFAPGADEDVLMEAALEAGAEDVIVHDDESIEVITNPNDWASIKAALESSGFKSEDGDITMRAQNEAELSGEDALKMQKLIDALEDLDDVQEVYTSAVLDFGE